MILGDQEPRQTNTQLWAIYAVSKNVYNIKCPIWSIIFTTLFLEWDTFLGGLNLEWDIFFRGLNSVSERDIYIYIKSLFILVTYLKTFFFWSSCCVVAGSLARSNFGRKNESLEMKLMKFIIRKAN